MISIILPVFNAEKYLSECLDSLLAQTYGCFELICIDDGSTDSSLGILEAYSKSDSRIRIYSRPNKGLVFTLNEGIRLSKYRYIARMDADDVCEPNRLEVQLKEMNDRSLDVCGTSYVYIDKEGRLIGKRKLPSSSKLVNYLMDFGSPLCHPSVMFDSQTLGDSLKYNSSAVHFEDYELWLRLRKEGFKLGNVSDFLFKYRILDSSISRQYSDEQREGSTRLLSRYADYSRNDLERIFLFSGKASLLQRLKYMALFPLRLILSGEPLRAFFVFFYLVKRIL